MISGGISHFKESPVYASYLIPLGIAISLVSFAIKNNFRLNKKDSVILALPVSVCLIILHVTLGFLGTYLFSDIPMGGDIFKMMH